MMIAAQVDHADPTHEGGGAATEMTRAQTEQRMRELYACYSKALMRRLLRLTAGQRQTAEDLLQETLLRAWKHLDRLDPEPERIGPWLHTVARRVALDAFRARQRRAPEVFHADFSNVPDADQAVDQIIARDTVHRVLSTLTKDHRAILEELYLNDRSNKTVAEVFGIPEGTVKSRCHLALRAARARVDAGSI